MVASWDNEIATTCGSLDDAVFDEGKPLTSHAVRQLSRVANRWSQKGEHWHCLSWNSSQTYTTDYLTHNLGGILHIARYTVWVRITPTFLQPKTPGINRMAAKIVSTASYSMKFSVTTSAVSDPDLFATSVAAGTQTTFIENIPVSNGPMEEITYWARGKDTDIAQADYGLGASACIAIVYMDGNRVRLNTSALVTDSVAQATGARALNYATAGTYVKIRDTTATTSTKTVPRTYDLISVPENHSIVLAPNVDQSYLGIFGSNKVAHLLRCPVFSVWTIAGAGQPRTDI